jgi:hypothetical protein
MKEIFFDVGLLVDFPSIIVLDLNEGDKVFFFDKSSTFII